MSALIGDESVIPSSYLPSFPPSKNIKPSYSRFLKAAPKTALATITPHARKPSEFPITTHCRVRVQVGVTNRWRLPAALGSDLLGTSQAVKAVSSSGINNNSNNTQVLPRRPNTYSWSELRVDAPSSSGKGLRDGLRSAPARLKMRDSIGQNERRSLYSRKSADDLSRQRNSREAVSLDADDDPLSWRFFSQMHQYDRYYVAPERRKPTPTESFHLIAQSTASYFDTDIVLNALNSRWNIHRSFAVKSQLLASLITQAKHETNRSDNVMSHQGFFPDAASDSQQGISVSIPKYPAMYYSTQRPNNTVLLNLNVQQDSHLITKDIFATALCSLYDEDHPFERCDVAEVLHVAELLQIDYLKNRCIEIMMQDVEVNNVCIFYAAANKFDILDLKSLCEQWLELNAVPILSSQIYLYQLTYAMLEKLLKSQRLFTYDEYSLFKLLCNWIFLKQHPNLEMIPSWGTVVTWFMSMPKKISFLEQDEGQQYHSLFKLLRLTGITNSVYLDEMSKMNIFPSKWLLKVLNQHYYSLQGGGDMSLMTRFENGSTRYGFIFDEAMSTYNEVLLLHGHIFEIKATLSNSADENYFMVYMQRLKPTDSLVSQRISKRQVFSVRQDREVRYVIKAQEGKSFIVHSIGPKSQCFGLNDKSERSENYSLVQMRASHVCPELKAKRRSNSFTQRKHMVENLKFKRIKLTNSGQL
eukprot:gene5656-6352_t